jgi:hypothetical protein
MSERKEIEKAIDEFAKVMKMRMRTKQKQGWHGWHNLPESVATTRMHDNAAKVRYQGDRMTKLVKAKQLADVANYAMMAWFGL